MSRVFGNWFSRGSVSGLRLGESWVFCLSGFGVKYKFNIFGFGHWGV